MLNANYPNKWIGRNGPIAWPPRSPDLNSLDFFLWGLLKAKVYVRPVENVEDLRQRIHDAFDAIRAMPGIFERVFESMKRRVEACLLANGRNFEQFL